MSVALLSGNESHFSQRYDAWRCAGEQSIWQVRADSYATPSPLYQELMNASRAGWWTALVASAR